MIIIPRVFFPSFSSLPSAEASALDQLAQLREQLAFEALGLWAAETIGKSSEKTEMGKPRGKMSGNDQHKTWGNGKNHGKNQINHGDLMY